MKFNKEINIWVLYRTYVHMYINTNKIEQNYSEMHPKTVQKPAKTLLKYRYCTSYGTLRYATVRYRQEYFVTIQKNIKFKKNRCVRYGTIPMSRIVIRIYNFFLMHFEIGEYFWHYKLFYKRTYVHTVSTCV